MYKVLLLTVVSLFAGKQEHPMHVSICEIELDSDRKAIEISQRIFTDDLERELAMELGVPNLDMGLKSKEWMDAEFKKYVQKHFAVEVDNKRLQTEYLGYELNAEVTFIYVQVPKVKKAKSVSVKYDVLTRVYDDQINLVHVKVGGVTKSMRLERGKSSDSVQFN